MDATSSSPATPATPTIDETAVKALAQDAIDAANLGKQVVTAWKSGGPAAASALLSQVISAGEKDYADLTAALPSIKAGYKTTEFWLTVGVMLLNGGYALVSGKTLPVDANVVLGAVVVIYTAARALVKKTA